MAKALEEDKKREAAEKRARREENEKRRDENARKNEVVQQVKTTPFSTHICLHGVLESYCKFLLDCGSLDLNSF